MRRPNVDGLPDVPSMPDGYALRVGRADDAERLAALLRSSFLDPEWDADRATKVLLAAPDVRETFLIERDGRLVATASSQLLPDRWPGSGVVHFVGADPAEGGKGLGYAVTLAVLHDFASIGCKDVVLTTDDHRLPAIKTYLRLGFRPHDCHPTHAERWATVFESLGQSVAFA